MAAQLSDEEKIKSADYVIDNSGPLAESQKRAQEIFSDLQSELRSAKIIPSIARLENKNHFPDYVRDSHETLASSVPRNPSRRSLFLYHHLPSFPSAHGGPIRRPPSK